MGKDDDPPPPPGVCFVQPNGKGEEEEGGARLVQQSSSSAASTASPCKELQRRRHSDGELNNSNDSSNSQSHTQLKELKNTFLKAPSSPQNGYKRVPTCEEEEELAEEERLDGGGEAAEAAAAAAGAAGGKAAAGAAAAVLRGAGAAAAAAARKALGRGPAASGHSRLTHSRGSSGASVKFVSEAASASSNASSASATPCHGKDPAHKSHRRTFSGGADSACAGDDLDLDDDLEDEEDLDDDRHPHYDDEGCVSDEGRVIILSPSSCEEELDVVETKFRGVKKEVDSGQEEGSAEDCSGKGVNADRTSQAAMGDRDYGSFQSTSTPKKTKSSSSARSAGEANSASMAAAAAASTSSRAVTNPAEPGNPSAGGGGGDEDSRRLLEDEEEESDQQPRPVSRVAAAPRGDSSDEDEVGAHNSSGYARHKSRKRRGGGGGGDVRIEVDEVDGGGDSDDPAPPSEDEPIPVELCKTFVAFLFLFGGGVATTLALALVHERVPTADPPLPDLFLNNVDYQAWGLDVSEIIIMAACFSTLVLMLAHASRTVVLRRVFFLGGLHYYYRAVTMYVTVLPKPNEHYKCAPKAGDDLTVLMVLHRVVKLLSGFGLSINGDHVYCGDYIYSGHTMTLVMTYLIVHQYSPRRWYLLHWASWCLAAFGVMVLLMARGHYSVDVVLAYWITTRLWWVYHTLANNPSLIRRENKENFLNRFWWWPIFNYLEGNVGRPLPKRYSWPVPERVQVVVRERWRSIRGRPEAAESEAAPPEAVVVVAPPPPSAGGSGGS